MDGLMGLRPMPGSMRKNNALGFDKGRAAGWLGRLRCLRFARGLARRAA
jgi:hypothetical protein